jgi:septum formation protein
MRRPLVLASASPRRADLLRAAGIAFEVIAATVDESVLPDEAPEAYASRVATAKAEAVLEQADGRPVLAADTVVVVDRRILGKPASSADAGRMLQLLSGRTHDVLTAVTLLIAGEDRAAAVERTAVTFAPLTEEEIAWYAASGEPADKAGGYAIQGLASRFVTRIDGSYANVVGLPVARVYQMLSRRGRL